MVQDVAHPLPEAGSLDAEGLGAFGEDEELDAVLGERRMGHVAVEAVRSYRERGSVRMDELMRCASICRVKKVIQPYLEAILFH